MDPSRELVQAQHELTAQLRAILAHLEAEADWRRGLVRKQAK